MKFVYIVEQILDISIKQSLDMNFFRTVYF